MIFLVQTKSAQRTAHQEVGISSILFYQVEYPPGWSTKWTPVKKVSSSILKLLENNKKYHIDYSNAKVSSGN